MKANREIRALKVRLIAQNGEQIGIVPIREAMERAQDAGLDLVEISPHANPPVCKIIDYGKYRYEIAKKEKESKKAQHQAKLKEVKFKPNIDKHDLDVKIERTRSFIEKGNKVRITCMFRGREMAYVKLGEQVIDCFIEELKEIAQIEASPKLIGRNLSLVLAPQGKKGR